MKLASLEYVTSVINHPNADLLDIVHVLGYDCIVARDEFKPGDIVVLIQPDTVLPDDPWAELFKKRSSRVKACKLRGEWSFGIIIDPKKLDANIPLVADNIGIDISAVIGVRKYEAPQPKELNAAGYLPISMPKTDEERYQNLLDKLPFGEYVDVTLKIDGQSATYFVIADKVTGEWREGICSRSLEIKKDCSNNYTNIEKKYNILEKLRDYCYKHRVSLALRGEIYGQGIQAYGKNPHAKLPLNFAAFSVFNYGTLKYENREDPHYYTKVCQELGLPTVPMIEENVILTNALIQFYAKDIKKLNEQSFEGVVIKHKTDTFKIINLAYDEAK